MSDKKMNDFATATDGAYIYAESASGEQIKISKADLASVVAGLTGVKYGTLYKNTTTTIRLGAGLLIITIGGSHFAMYALDYWSSVITLIAGKPIDNYGTITQKSDDKFSFEFTVIKETDLRYYFIGYRL